MSRWWRCYEGAPFDPKWRVVAARVGGRPGDVWAVATALHDYASQHEGSIAGIDFEDIAAGLGYDATYVTAVTVTLVNKSYIENDRLTAWENRQYKDDSAPRVRAFRERKKLEKINENNEETERVTVVTTLPLQSNGETPQIQRREDKDSLSPRADAVAVIRCFDEARIAVFGAAAARPWPDATDETYARRLLDAGADLPLLTATFRSVMARFKAEGGEPPDKIRIMEKWVLGALRDNRKPMPEAGNVNGNNVNGHHGAKLSGNSREERLRQLAERSPGGSERLASVVPGPGGIVIDHTAGSPGARRMSAGAGERG